MFTSVLRIFKFKNLNLFIALLNDRAARNKIALIESDPKNQPKLRKQTEK